jgi:hypothetical protein
MADRWQSRAADSHSEEKRLRFSVLETRTWIVLALVVVAANLVLRVLYLTTIPGINGDECQGGVLMREWLSGRTPPPWITQSNRFVPFAVAFASLAYLPGAPSAWQLRAIPFVAGLLTIVAVWFAARAVFRQRWVRIGVVLTAACAPIQLVYSRLSWDPMLTSLSALLLIVFILKGRYGWSLFGAAVGFLVHPNAVFFVPYGLLCFVVEALPRYVKTRRNRVLLVAGLFAGAVPVSVWMYEHFIGVGGTGIRFWAYGLGTFKNYLLYMGGVLSGSVSFEGFVAKPTGAAAAMFGVLNAAIVLGLCWCAVRAWRRSDTGIGRRLFPLGVLTALALMYVFVPLIDAGHDRYALAFVLPMIFAFGLAVDDSNLSAAVQQRIAVLLPAWLLASYCAFFVGAFLSTGGYQFSPYQAGPVDPKAAATHWILADSEARLGPNQPVRIVADSWWVFWPVRYLTMDNGLVRVEHIDVVDLTMPADAKITNHADLEEALHQNGYAVGFGNGYLARNLPALRRSEICGTRDFLDYAGRPAVTAYRVCPAR